MSISAHQIKSLARDCGFELAGIAPVRTEPDFGRFDRWRNDGLAGEMTYLTDRRGDLRQDARALLPSARSIVCVGKRYNTDGPPNGFETAPGEGRISRYALGDDYHVTMRASLKELAGRIAAEHGEPMEARCCVDTAPLLERSLAREAGLGWIGKNTCLINQAEGSWFFLGEVLLSIPIAPDTPPPDRCGTCRRCIDACPTAAILPDAEGGSRIDSRLCISYLTIEHRGDLPEGMAAATGNHLFGCDICQEVCPWNRDAAITTDPAFQPHAVATSLAELAAYSAEDFARSFRATPVWRARYPGFLRNVATAMGNSGQAELQAPLQQLAELDDPVIAAAARAALERLPDRRAGSESTSMRTE